MAVGLRTTIDELSPWYQNIELESGVWTNPALPDHPRRRWEAIQPFLSDVKDKTVLDIGCNAGFFSIQLKRLGARRVVGVDNDPNVLKQAAFLARHFSVDIEVYEREAYDILDFGRFDIVLCLGILYHLRHPLLLLDNVRQICAGRLFVQMVLRGASGDFVPLADHAITEAEIFDVPEYPRLFFVERMINGDHSNWWFANRSCLLAMVRSAGFTDIQPTSQSETFVCRPCGSPKVQDVEPA